tara:strand:- start:4 stop:1182 length:1179 start_codon:yes stop_codon:yes gene_type:complete
MKLNDLFLKHPRVSLATEEDNKEILSFFSTLPMEGTKTAISYDRKPDFFKFLSFCGPLFFVFLVRLKKEAGICGVGTLVLRPGFIKGEKKWVGYLGDLRIQPGPRASVIWRKFYGDLVEHAHLIEEFGGCEFFYTSILRENQKAMNALVYNKKNPFQYFPLVQYKMVNILLRHPGHYLTNIFKKRIEGVKFSRGSMEDKDAITEFLRNQNRERSFGFCFEEKFDELNFRIERWNNLLLENFILARDSKNKIVGLTLLWTPSPSKKIKIDRLQPFLKLYFQLQKVFKKSPKEGGELEVLYLNFLELKGSLPKDQKSMLFTSMIEYIYGLPISKDYHALSYCAFEGTPIDDLKGYIKHDTLLSLFLVQRRKEAGKDGAMPIVGEIPPGFEMSLV